MGQYFLLLSIFFTNYTFAQVNINGRITDSKNKGIPGVSISLLNSYDGTTSDSLGNYHFSTIEKGEQNLLISASGYKDYSQKIIVTGTASLTINITLKEKITELKAVVISAGTFEASDQKRATALNPLDIVTTASANGDITNALKTLPGTQQVGESEGLFVRGGTSSEAKFFIDGSLVNQFFYSSEPGQATRGRFNPFLFKGTVFSSGGYSALYGQAMSSTIILESIDLPERSSADFGISYLAANAGLQHLAKNKKSSWGATYSYTNLEFAFSLVKQKFDYFQVPVVHQGDFNYRIKTSKTGILKYYAMVSHTKVGFRNQDVDSLVLKDAFALKNLNMYHNLSWRENLGKGWRLHLGGSYTNNTDNIKMELQEASGKKQDIPGNEFFANKNAGLKNTGNYANAKVVVEKKLTGLSAFRFGAEDNYSQEKSDFLNYKSEMFKTKLIENIVSGFAETDIYVTNQIAAKIGARAEHSKLLEKWNIAPRASLAYQFADRSQASLAYGIFYQNPENKYLPALEALHFQKATHYIAQYQKMSSLQTFRIEAFFKKYSDLIKTLGYQARELAFNNKGFGDAKGIELFWRDKKTIPNFDYWISYSYLDTKRNFLNYPSSLRPDFSSKHTASLVLKKFVLPLKTQFNASYTYASGRPYYDFSYDNNGKTYIKEKGITKDYNNLSLSINYLPNISNTKAKAFTVFVLSLTNVLGANNIYSYRFSANGENKLAVGPPAKRFLYLGCFISLGIDRTEDVINNNL